jgi:hypothetical protein
LLKTYPYCGPWLVVNLHLRRGKKEASCKHTAVLQTAIMICKYEGEQSLSATAGEVGFAVSTVCCVKDAACIR